MDLRSLISFLRVAEMRSLTRAAERLNITQPALSRQIRLLEQDLRVDLFERHGRGVTLTPAGVLLRERAHAIVSEVKRATADVGSMSEKCVGEVRIGFLPSARLLLTIPLLEKLRVEFPDVFVTIIEASSSEMVEQISAGVLDVAVIAAADRTGAPPGTPLIDVDLLLAGHKDLMKDAGAVVTPEFLSTVPLIITPHHDAQREIVYSYLAARSRSANVAYHVSSLELAIEMMRRKMGCYTIASCVAAQVSQAMKEVVIRPIQDLSVHWVSIQSKEPGPKRIVDRVLAILKRIAATPTT